MEMIEILKKKKKQMIEIRRKEEHMANKAAQDAIDSKHQKLVEQVHAQIECLYYAKENMQFQLSQTTIEELQSLLENLKNCIKSGYVEKEIVDQIENDFKSVLNTIKKEWTKQYADLTGSTISTLKVIAGINADQVRNCLTGIIKGEKWTTDIDEFKIMNQKLNEAENLIHGLGLDYQIVEFLQKMNNGKATVADLNERVLEWIKDEKLDKKVKLSFSGTARKV